MTKNQTGGNEEIEEGVLRRSNEKGTRERELFVMKRFNKFLGGRKFLMKTDHLPLKVLLTKPLHSFEKSRLRVMVSVPNYLNMNSILKLFLEVERKFFCRLISEEIVWMSYIFLS
jgi:hypothetical protein